MMDEEDKVLEHKIISNDLDGEKLQEVSIFEEEAALNPNDFLQQMLGGDDVSIE